MNISNISCLFFIMSLAGCPLSRCERAVTPRGGLCTMVKKTGENDCPATPRFSYLLGAPKQLNYFYWPQFPPL